MNASAPAPLRVHVRRIYSEYLEMPGLRLTSAQAQRLWGLDRTTCIAALDYLIAAKFLCYTATGQYARLTDGAFSLPPFRMTKARLRRKQMPARFAL